MWWYEYEWIWWPILHWVPHIYQQMFGETNTNIELGAINGYFQEGGIVNLSCLGKIGSS